MLRSISKFSAGKRTKWVVLAVWIIAAVVLGPLQPELQKNTTNENSDFLPKSSESTKVNNLLQRQFPNGREVDALIAFTTSSGGALTPADKASIQKDIDAVCALRGKKTKEVPKLITIISPFTGPNCPSKASIAGSPTDAKQASSSEIASAQAQLISKDRSTALVLVRTNAESSTGIMKTVKVLRDNLPGPDAKPLESYVTGIAGIVSDSIEVFEGLDVTLLLVTVSLVLILLLLIYRSPVIALVPLFVVGLAYVIAAAVVLGLIKAGAFKVNGQTTSLLIVLMFGAGTDYCLLIVARFKEELRKTADKHEAMARATERTAPAILSAGGTVVLAMLVLLLANYKGTATLGPTLAIGVAIMVLAGLTLLPALLSILGRGAFWPAVPKQGSTGVGRVNFWHRVGHFVHEHHIFVMITVILVLALGALGNLKPRGTLDFGEGFRNPPESVLGQDLIKKQLSGGETAPTEAVVTAGAAPRVSEALKQVDGVSQVVPSELSKDGKYAQLSVTLTANPFSDEAANTIPKLRKAAHRAADGQLALVGGSTAENYDTSKTLRADANLIVPLILLVIFLILCFLLRAVVAPAYLVFTVILSFAFALGASYLIFDWVLGQGSSDAGLPTFAFIFLVALGVDYNIFLMSRIREEAEHEETKEAVIEGLEKTGGVISSAGLILAGTFASLTALPLEALFQIGFVVAFGLLVDTFIVRTLLVPSIAFQFDEKNWWPSRIERKPRSKPRKATSKSAAKPKARKSSAKAPPKKRKPAAKPKRKKKS